MRSYEDWMAEQLKVEDEIEKGGMTMLPDGTHTIAKSIQSKADTDSQYAIAWAILLLTNAVDEIRRVMEQQAQMRAQEDLAERMWQDTIDEAEE